MPTNYQIVSKAGVHSVGGARQDYGPALQEIYNAGRKIAGVKGRDDLGIVDQALALWPDMLCIGVKTQWDGGPFNAQQAVNLILQAYQSKPVIKIWEFLNEINGLWSEQADLYIQMMPLMAQHGLTLEMFSCAVGTPQYPAAVTFLQRAKSATIDLGKALKYGVFWKRLKRALTHTTESPYEAVLRACRYAVEHGYKVRLGLHEYVHHEHPDQSEHMIGRFKTLADYLELNGALVPIDITEYLTETFPGDAEWQRLLQKYDQLYHDDPRVKTLMLWTVGGGGWGGSNWQTSMRWWGHYIATVQFPEVPPTEPPPDPVEPTYSGQFAGNTLTMKDGAGIIWELGYPHQEPGYPVLKNGVQYAGGFAEVLLYYNGVVYVSNSFGNWYRPTTSGWEKVPGDPRQNPEIPPPEPEPETFWCSWPVKTSEAPRITDGGHFNDPRGYGNGQHEGVDGDGYDNVLARSAEVIAAQDGIVEYVNAKRNPTTGAYEGYGLHVVIRHPWGSQTHRYRTLYGHLYSVSVVAGQNVQRGQVIGIAGKTGTEAIHLHFNVHDTEEGFTGYVRCSDCSGKWDDGVLNPETIIRYEDGPPPPVNTNLWRGLHMRADGGVVQSQDMVAAQIGRMEALKLYQPAVENYTILLTRGFDLSKLLIRPGHITDRVATVDNYINAQNTGIWDGPFREAAANGAIWIDPWNEVDLPEEGYGRAWRSITEFCDLYKAVITRAISKYPTLRFLSTALSQQPARFQWWQAFQAQGVFALSHGYACHCYWATRNGQYPMEGNGDGRSYRDLIPYLTTGKSIWLTEVSNNATTDSDTAKGEQYADYLASLEPQVKACFFFCSSASDPFFNQRRETWVRNNVLSQIPYAVGEMPA